MYLAIVDLPSKEELKEATEIMARADPEHAAQYANLDLDAAASRTPSAIPPEYAGEHPNDPAFQAARAREFEEAYGFPPRNESLGPHPTYVDASPPRYEEVPGQGTGSGGS
jgi:hypothetical protein